MIYLSKEEAEERIESGDMEVINGLVTGEIVIGEAPEGEEVTEEIADVADETLVEEPIQDEVVAEPVVEKKDGVSEQDYNDLLSKYEQESKRAKEALERVEEERRQAEQAKALLDSIKNESVLDSKGINITLPELAEDETDVDLAGSYSKNNRELLNSFKETLGSAASVEQVSALEAKLNSVLEIESRRAEEEKARAAKHAEQERMNKLFSEVDAFAGTHEHFQMDEGTADVYRDVESFKLRLKDYLRTDDQRIVEKAYRKVVSGEDQRMVEDITKVGIEIPKNANTYLKLAEVVDLKNGFTFNKHTGEFEPILNDFGVRVAQRSLEDAYKLSRFEDIMHEREARQVGEIEKRLTARDESAVTLPESAITDGSENGMSSEEVNQILNMPSSAFRNNPALQAKLDAIINR